MAYRNKTYVAFASEDIKSYYLMLAWKANQNIDFDFFDAHDINTALDTSKPETIKARLRERLRNTKQAVLLASEKAKQKAADKDSFLTYEIAVLLEFKIPIVISNLDGNRGLVFASTPTALLSKQQTLMFTSFQPKIIRYALDDFVEKFNSGEYKEPQTLRYTDSKYAELGL
jgi:MTH538 TIR-like domain (DUF1863)